MKITKNYLRKLIKESMNENEMDPSSDENSPYYDPSAHAEYGKPAVEHGLAEMKSGLEDLVQKNPRNQKYSEMLKLVSRLEQLYKQP